MNPRKKIILFSVTVTDTNRRELGDLNVLIVMLHLMLGMAAVIVALD